MIGISGCQVRDDLFHSVVDRRMADTLQKSSSFESHYCTPGRSGGTETKRHRYCSFPHKPVLLRVRSASCLERGACLLAPVARPGAREAYSG